jgi:hypothetical protein
VVTANNSSVNGYYVRADHEDWRILNFDAPFPELFVNDSFNNWKYLHVPLMGPEADGRRYRVRCRIAPKDRLYVRETWSDASGTGGQKVALYRATYSGPSSVIWRPSIFMPRWASRVLVEVTDVNVQRVQKISEEDAIKEGFYQAVRESASGVGQDVVGWYARLWDRINGKTYPWKSNPLVWIYTFKVLEVN